MYSVLEMVKSDEKFEFELAELGDLSKFSFDELSNMLNNFTFTKYEAHDNFVAIFESKYSSIEIKYTTSGEFVKILDQNWK